MQTQKRTACISCPWRTERDGSYFNADLLTNTVVEDHLSERIHSCHGNDNHFCAGYLAFLVAQPYGLAGHALARMAIDLRLINPALIPTDVGVFATVGDMLKNHQDHHKNRFNRKYSHGTTI